MIVDSHTHAAPDKIARAVEQASQNTLQAGGVHLHDSMTVGALVAALRRHGIDRAVVFCVAEKPSVVTKANDFLFGAAAEHPFLAACCTIHPESEDAEREIARIRRLGGCGIKFHPVFQSFLADEPRMLRIYELMGADLVAYFHCGHDPSRPGQESGVTPARLARIRELFPQLRIVAAHLGGYGMAQEVRRFLVGRDFFFDTSWVPSVADLNPREVVALVRDHGVHRVLFGSDFPWTDLTAQLQWVRGLSLTEEERELVLGGNASRLFWGRSSAA
ncbi:MAG: amidohydrolase family protein [Dehalococcoidia bacterium]|nr:amidohydrolase family protein [Dehalococcoidia bacterium]